MRDDFDPYCYTPEQQRAPMREAIVSEMIRFALLSPLPSLMGAMLDPETGEPLFPNLAKRNREIRARANG